MSKTLVIAATAAMMLAGPDEEQFPLSTGCCEEHQILE